MLDQIRPKQSRSRARRAALIELGIEMLNASDLEEISVADMTKRLNISTGSFYTYFDDKSAFFVSVQRAVAQALDAQIATEFETCAFKQLAPPEKLRRCVSSILAYFRKHTGVLRCALRYEHRIPEAWAPNRVSAQRTVEAMVAGMPEDVARRMRVATQMAFGAMVNALLHDPGPLRLNDPAFGAEILAALTPYLEEAGTNPEDEKSKGEQ